MRTLLEGLRFRGVNEQELRTDDDALRPFLSVPPGRIVGMESLHVDCASCRARGPACSDCVISALLGPIDADVQLGTDEVGALAALAGGGLIAPLRLIRGSAQEHRFPPETGTGLATAMPYP